MGGARILQQQDEISAKNKMQHAQCVVHTLKIHTPNTIWLPSYTDTQARLSQMMKTKKNRKKTKLAPSLGPFKQALVARLNPEFLPLSAERSREGPESCSSMMKFEQKKNASCLVYGSHIGNSHPKHNLAPQLSLTPKLG
jgi:hypothetical protein